MEVAGMEEAKKMSKKKKLIIGFVGVVVFILLAVFLTVHFYLNKINVQDAQNEVLNNLFGGEKYQTVEYSQGSEVTQDELKNMQKAIDKNTARTVVSEMYKDEVINILLIGSDMRVKGSTSRSDTIILLSINKDTKEITVTSFMRDIYLHIPGYGYNRINAAYAFGVPQTVLDTIEDNFKIKVDKFVDINFYTFIDVVDDLGGVTIDVDWDDIDDINQSVEEENYYLGLDEYNGFLKTGGRLQLNGKRTLAYVRNRHYDNGDFTRTEHQREVVTQLSRIIFKLSPEEANALMQKYLPLVTTNLTEREMYSLILYLKEFSGYKINQICVPSDDSFDYVMINGMSVLRVDFPKNIDAITKTIYNQDGKKQTNKKSTTE